MFRTAIFQLQTIKINNNRYSIFFDGGCDDFVPRYSTIRSLTSNATKEHAGPVAIGGVGGVTSVSQHEIYKINLPLYDGSQATMSGVYCDNITSKFPLYPIEGKVLNDINKAYKGGDARSLPKIPKSVGGKKDFMIGIKYLRYYPKMIFQLPSGLTICESVFENADGDRGEIGGPHEILNNIRNYHAEDSIHITFFSNQYSLYRNGYQVNLNISLLSFKKSNQMYDIYNNDPENCTNYSDIHITKIQKQFK